VYEFKSNQIKSNQFFISAFEIFLENGAGMGWRELDLFFLFGFFLGGKGGGVVFFMDICTWMGWGGVGWGGVR